MFTLWTRDLPTTGLGWAAVRKELPELIEELRSFNIHGIISELGDVYTCVMCAIGLSLNINVPILWTTTARDWLHRANWVASYLNNIGLEYKVEYLKHGGNYHRPHKRRMFVRLAVKDQLGINLN